MGDLKLYDKDENQLSFPVNTVHGFSTDIRMEFGILKSGKIYQKEASCSTYQVLNYRIEMLLNNVKQMAMNTVF